MARITVEDCLDNVDNRFQLVLTAAKRARQLANGKPPLLEWENDKPTVMALREIADGLVTSSILDEVEVEASEEEEMVADESLDSEVQALLAAGNEIVQQPSSEETDVTDSEAGDAEAP